MHLMIKNITTTTPPRRKKHGVVEKLQKDWLYIILILKKIVEFMITYKPFNVAAVGPLHLLKIFAKFFKKFLHSIEHSGKKNTIARFKHYYAVGVQIALKQPITPKPFMKSTKKTHIPYDILDFVPYLESSNKWGPRLALTGLRIYTLLTLTPVGDFSAIVSPAKVSTQREETLKGFHAFITSVKLPKRIYQDYREEDIVASIHSGPNGPALLTSHLDVLALEQEGLADVIQEGLSSTSSNFAATFGVIRGGIDKVRSLVSHPETLLSGRISLIAEPGGKTRIIAILDYWSQLLLRPIHLGLMDILKTLPGDGTFDQNAAFNRALKASKTHPVFSFDLSNATDRFPIEPQIAVVTSVFGQEIGQLWTDIISKREFGVTGVSPLKGRTVVQKVKWNVGQPLGAYSSWATFSLTHHLLVAYANFLCLKDSGTITKAQNYNFFGFSEYVILGDDICIWNKKVSEKYVELLNALDVPINYGKSITSFLPNVNVGEFCKRIFVNGIEVSPISLNAILSVQESLYNLPSLTEMIFHRWGIPTSILELWVKESGTFTAKPLLLSLIMSFRQLVNGYNAFPYCQFDPVTTLKELRFHLINLASQRKSFFSNKPLSPDFNPNSPYEGCVTYASELAPILEKSGLGVPAFLFPETQLWMMVPNVYRFHPVVIAYFDQLQAVKKQSENRQLGFSPESVTKRERYHSDQFNYFKRVRQLSLDLFFLKTKRRNVKFTTSIAVKWYFDQLDLQRKGVLYEEIRSAEASVNRYQSRFSYG